MKTLVKGQAVVITGNEIFGFMGYQTVSGTVFTVRADGSGFSIKCNETGAIETVDFGDGVIELNEGSVK